MWDEGRLCRICECWVHAGCRLGSSCVQAVCRLGAGCVQAVCRLGGVLGVGGHAGWWATGRTAGHVVHIRRVPALRGNSQLGVSLVGVTRHLRVGPSATRVTPEPLHTHCLLSQTPTHTLSPVTDTRTHTVSCHIHPHNTLPAVTDTHIHPASCHRHLHTHTLPPVTDTHIYTLPSVPDTHTP